MAPVGARGARLRRAGGPAQSAPSWPFDPAAQGQFDLDSPPGPWLDLGWVENFQRTAGHQVRSAAQRPSGNITVQYRAQPEARLEFDLPSWGKLQMAMAGGTQQMNVLAVVPLSRAARFRRRGDSASPLQSGFHHTPRWC